MTNKYIELLDNQLQDLARETQNLLREIDRVHKEEAKMQHRMAQIAGAISEMQKLKETYSEVDNDQESRISESFSQLDEAKSAYEGSLQAKEAIPSD